MPERHVFFVDDVPLTELRPGLFGKVFPGAEMTMVRWTFQPGMPRTGIHVHTDHEQYGVILQGRVEMQVGEEVVQLGPGDTYWCPRNLPHGRTLVLSDVPAHVLDVFTPARVEYAKAAASAESASDTPSAQE
jgi:quercetin dioxygenase-like cupin family protein